MDQYIGKMLDNRYEILEIIGRGGMAVVYKAKCHRLNRFVAVKILKDDLAQDEEFRQRFRDESQAVAMLSHPNIVAVYDVSRTSDVEYIVMELIDGITLKDYLERQSPLGWKETTFFAVQIAKALEHAHSRGIIHRDIKPQNIMVLRDGTVKVADFGIARQAASNNTYNLAEAIGSVHYVSPEQARGSHIDNRSDLYSLGVVMYEMLTGRLPFVGDTPLAVALQHINSIPLPPSDYVADIPKTLENIVMKAMAPATADRYANATELIGDIEHFRNDPHYKVDVPAAAPVAAPIPGDGGETQVIQYASQLPPAPRRQPTAPRNHEVDESEEYAAQPRGKRKISGSLIFTILAITIFVVGAGFFIMAVVNPFGKGAKDPEGQPVLAPSLVGKLYSEVAADETLRQQGITIKEEKRVFDDTVEEDHIISQEPKEGRTLPDDKVITVVVSKGMAQGEMPDLVNKEYRVAEQLLQSDARTAGIEIKVVTESEFSEEYAMDQVTRTVPEAGAQLQDGDEVKIYYSKGKEVLPTTVPNVVGLDLAAAKKKITDKKLLVKVTEVESDQPEGNVVKQSIAADTEVEENTVVDLEVSKGKPQPKEVETYLQVNISPDINDPAAQVKVIVQVDGKVQYNKEHSPTDGTISVPLKALQGDHTVTVIQNGTVVSESTVSFQ